MGEKAEKLYKVYTTKLASLQDEKAKAFANEVINSAKKVQREFIIGDKINIVQLKKTAKYTFEQFNELPTESKEELNKTFPKLIAFFQSELYILKKLSRHFRQEVLDANWRKLERSIHI